MEIALKEVRDRGDERRRPHDEKTRGYGADDLDTQKDIHRGDHHDPPADPEEPCRDSRDQADKSAKQGCGIAVWIQPTSEQQAQLFGFFPREHQPRDVEQ